MKSFSILLAAVSLLGVSCERHEFEGPNGTKQLHEHHAAGGHGEEHHDSDGHGHDKKEDDSHVEKDGH